MKYTIALCILLFSLMIISCKETKKTIKVSSNEFYSGKYEIKNLNGNELSRNLRFTIETSENKISGKTNCNNYFGTYTVSNANELKIGPLSATEMYCEEKVMKAERELFKAYYGQEDWAAAKRIVEGSIKPDSKEGRKNRLADLAGQNYDEI